MSINNLLTMRGTLQKKTITKAADKSTSITWTTVGTNVPCFMFYLMTGSRNIMTYTGADVVNKLYVFFRSDQEAENGYKFTCNGKEYFLVGGIPQVNPRTGRTSHKEFLLNLDEL